MNGDLRRSLKYLEFRQVVRRYRPSDLIPALAQHSAAAAMVQANRRDQEGVRRDTPWAVSGIARESVLYGNDHRNGDVGPATVRELIRSFNETFDELTDLSLAAMITPIVYEQFTYGESEFEELARIQALFEDATLGPELDWSEIFGIPLCDAVRAVFVLNAWVQFNGGRYDSALLDEEQMQGVFARIAPREHIESLARELVTSIPAAKSTNASVPALSPELQRYAFNPLTARPLVDLGGERGVWAPQVMLVNRAVFPANLYYRGMAKWGNRFAETLGTRAEKYVGRQLGLVAKQDELHGEIEYREGKNKKKSVDWIWVTSQAVILFECKSARLTLGARAGDGSLAALVERYVIHARQQLDRTARLIRARTPPFDRFPIDRPIVGMAVTTEPFYLGNSALEEYGKRSDIPSMVVSLRDLEYWVCLPASQAVAMFLGILDDPERRTWALHTALRPLQGLGKNPILDAAWRRLDFGSQFGAAG